MNALQTGLITPGSNARLTFSFLRTVRDVRRHGLRRLLVMCWSEPRFDSLNECGAPGFASRSLNPSDVPQIGHSAGM